MTKDEAMELALEALEKIYIAPEHGEYIRVWWPACEQAITAIKEALAQPEQEPVAYINVDKRCLEWALPTRWLTPTVAKMERVALYTTPPQRKPLTDEQILEMWGLHDVDPGIVDFVRAVEAAHGIGENT